MESVLLFLGREMEDSSATDEDSEDENQNGDEIEGKAKILSIKKNRKLCPKTMRHFFCFKISILLHSGLNPQPDTSGCQQDFLCV